jgi:hypothetical protein
MDDKYVAHAAIYGKILRRSHLPCSLEGKTRT